MQDMHLSKGFLHTAREGRANDIRQAIMIVCHSILGGDNAVCRGYFERRSSFALCLAVATGNIKYQKIEKK